MRLAILIMTLMPAVNALPGQEKTAEARQEDREAAVFHVKHLSGDAFNRLPKLLMAFGAQFQSDDQLRTIVAYAPKHVLNEMRRVIEELDRPDSPILLGRNIQMTVAFLLCSQQPQPATGPLPGELEPVAKQLRAGGLCKELRLWDLLPLHLQEGKVTRLTLDLPSLRPGYPGALVRAHVMLQPEFVAQRDSGRYLRVRTLDFTVNFPDPRSVVGEEKRPAAYLGPLTLSTSGEFKEGQKAVLGKLTTLDDLTGVFAVIWFRVLD
jgi:hypothetical protein